jgi:hypothetical protein
MRSRARIVLLRIDILHIVSGHGPLGLALALPLQLRALVLGRVSTARVRQEAEASSQR